MSRMLTISLLRRSCGTGPGIGISGVSSGSGVVAPRVGSMPGRAVGDGDGVSLGLAGVGVPVASGVPLAGPGMAEGPAPADVLTGAVVAAAVAAAVAGGIDGEAVSVASRNGRVQVGTGVRGSAVGGGVGAQAESANTSMRRQETKPDRRIGCYSNPFKNRIGLQVRRGPAALCSKRCQACQARYGFLNNGRLVPGGWTLRSAATPPKRLGGRRAQPPPTVGQ